MTRVLSSLEQFCQKSQSIVKTEKPGVFRRIHKRPLRCTVLVMLRYRLYEVTQSYISCVLPEPCYSSVMSVLCNLTYVAVT